MADFPWQDAVFTAGSIVFLIALIPTILGPSKPAASTSAMTGTVLLLFAVTYLTLGLYLSAVTTSLTAAAWLTVLVQTLRGNRG